MKQYIIQIEKELAQYIAVLKAPTLIKEAMDYSLQAGGKRIRPILLLATLHALNQDINKGLSAACAVEMVHTYSLIHDDLPAMDNDDLRRGKPTNHKVYGEAIAILAGDGLLTYSFQLIAEDERLTSNEKLELITMLSRAAGSEGMVGGQVADMQGENTTLSIDQLQYIHANKTGKLITFSVMAGALIGGATEKQQDLLKEYSKHLGIAFQIRDDVLDIEGNQDIIGKPIGSDVTNHKSTYPSLLSLDGAKDRLQYHIEEAKGMLKKTGLRAELLAQMTDLIAMRNY
ncbi:polyprenyl synthetase family protein [Bacillus sp. FJAT-49736]|uniref:polyprenyl synthetase family protein n=1 Tax=Bacillus sp. FJAT-49736 TaxID=2833582 RepID=UPI001BC95A2D|nr:farnesyl diphosphate synthase [Bacillus sp. FJAT-49736]MBS4173415.1 polyprenyl synthetase family protein [Bacillus sp. FJAT-49736]